MKISRVKLFQFQRADGDMVEIAVPPNWSQALIPKVRHGDYTVNVVISATAPAEADFGKVAVGNGHTAGYVIPGAAILSPENPHDADETYCAYNILVADAVCRSSQIGNYELGSKNCQQANSLSQIFRRDSYYLITWNRYFTSPAALSKDFALALCDHGLIFSHSEEHPSQLYLEYKGNGSTLRLKSTPQLPSYVVTILSSLVPYCNNPFLRFFYLYQVIEYLMGIEFDLKVSNVRERFLETQNPSMVELREILDKFQDATREKARINVALVPACPTTSLSAETLLSALNALEPDTSFAERIYRVRNILFHDYKQLHDRGEQIALLCQDLFAYLISKKLLS